MSIGGMKLFLRLAQPSRPPSQPVADLPRQPPLRPRLDGFLHRSTLTGRVLFVLVLIAPVVRQNVVIAEPVLLSAATPDRIRACLN